MTEVIIIIIIAVFLYFLFLNKKAGDNDFPVNGSGNKKKEYIKAEELAENKIFADENGQYRILEKTREIPRRTYIKGILNGKYWGEIDENISSQFSHSKFYEFNVYEVTLKNAVYSSSPYILEQDLSIAREKLPKYLNTVLEKDGKEYELNLHNPVFADIKFNRKLHQAEGKEVFGTIDAIVSGYVLDYTKELYFEKEYIVQFKEVIPPPKIADPVFAKTNTPTGNVEYKGNYKRTEYYYSDFKQTFWGDWKYVKPPSTSNNEGCFSSIIGFIAGIIGIAFLLMILPQIAFIFPFLLILFLLNLIPARYFSWLFRILGILILLGFSLSLYNYFKNTSTRSYVPKPFVTNDLEERYIRTETFVDTFNNITKTDSIIKHFRVWHDYDGNKYEGTIWTKKSDFINAKKFKNNLPFSSITSSGYDEIIFRIKENDKNNLSGVYQLFDSLSHAKKISSIKFAELIVSFVQDIPYAVIVPDGCNPNLYNDEFLRQYLSSAGARCDGLEKFGINSPVEFMSSLYGDCDTRTLLLYTMLNHYGYDVALFSSEYYAHSLIGLNLPLSGIAYQYQNQRYVLWETTAPNAKAGILPKEISNLNYWRISLKSK